MWNLTNIPKTVHFYWGGKRLSFLQFMSVYTFWQLNPDWTIKIHTSVAQNKSITWNTKEQAYADTYEDFTSRLGEIPVKFVYHDLNEYGLPSTLTEVHKSDILRLKILSEEGGLYSDMDILFIKPVDALECNKIENASKDTFVSLCHYGHSIGFLMSCPNNTFFKTLYTKASAIVSSDTALGYQSIGAPMINKMYPKIHDIPSSYNISMDSVYPYNANQIEELFTSNKDRTTANTVGVHWFAGAQQAGEYLNNSNGGLRNPNPCIVTSLLYKNSTSQTKVIPITHKYSSPKIFLYGISGTGKTTYAKNYANTHNIRYVDFDLYFGIVNRGWVHKYGTENFLNSLPDSFITEYIGTNSYAFLDYAKGKDIQVIVFDCTNKEEHLARLNKKNIALPDLSYNHFMVEFLKQNNIKVDYYDSRTV